MNGKFGNNRKSRMMRIAAGCMTALLLLSSVSAFGSAEAVDEDDMNPYTDAKNAALSALSSRMDAEREAVYVYKDFGMSENHFTQKMKMAGTDYDLVKNMDENWQENVYAGSSCIRCEQTTRKGEWGGWMFVNGYLPEGESIPRLNDGSMGGQGLDLTGAEALRFFARGETGDEVVEFFTCGFGHSAPLAPYRDSAGKIALPAVELTTEWKEYVIPLSGLDLRTIVCGFGYAMNGLLDGDGNHVFYLDEIRFTGNICAAQTAPVLLRSYDTENLYIKNVAFSYDNALTAMAFLSEGKQKEAGQILDAFVYAVENDRALPSAASESGDTTGAKRVRNAYAAGDISPYPGWAGGAKLPGWYDNETGEWYEDRYQVGSNVGNTSYVALALMQYYRAYGGEKYLESARALMDWVIETCSDGGDGFTGGFDGWEESSPPVVYPFTYKSIEHNIDAFAVFTALYKTTGEEKYRDAAMSAKRFIESMYDDERGLFMTGTLEDGITPNTGVVVLDAQVWCAMALGEDFEPYKDALRTVERMRTAEGGYPFCLENRNGGWWAEGTAYTALMYRGLGNKQAYEAAMDALVNLQRRDGLFPAATVDNLSTGMELFDGSPWEYSTDAHIAPTAWFIMAANGFNPYAFDEAVAQDEN